MAEEEAFGSASSHQAALARLADWLKMEGLREIPKTAAFLARLAEWFKGQAEKLMFEGNIHASVAEPDKLSLPLQATASDSVVAFLTRKKHYAAQSLNNRLQQNDLPAEQQLHAVETLALITGRAFHSNAAEDKVSVAKQWLAKWLP